MRAAIYCRYSTDKQREASIADQTCNCRCIAEREVMAKQWTKLRECGFYKFGRPVSALRRIIHLARRPLLAGQRLPGRSGSSYGNVSISASM
jgi:hypothetical protein